MHRLGTIWMALSPSETETDTKALYGLVTIRKYTYFSLLHELEGLDVMTVSIVE